MSLKEFPEKPDAPFTEETIVTAFGKAARIAEEFCKWAIPQISPGKTFQEKRLVVFYGSTKNELEGTVDSKEEGPLLVQPRTQELFFDPQEYLLVLKQDRTSRRHPEILITLGVFHDFVHLMQAQNLLPLSAKIGISSRNQEQISEDQADFLSGVMLRWMQEQQPRLQAGELKAAAAIMAFLGADSPKTFRGRVIKIFQKQRWKTIVDTHRQRYGHATSAVRAGWFLKGWNSDLSRSRASNAGLFR